MGLFKYFCKIYTLVEIFNNIEIFVEIFNIACKSVEPDSALKFYILVGFFLEYLHISVNPVVRRRFLALRNSILREIAQV